MDHVSNFVKRFRGSRDLSLDELSAMTGVSRSMICQIEQAKTSPTLAILTRLADGMKVPLADLVDPGRGPTLYRRSNVNESRITRSRDKAFECALLTAGSSNRHLEMYRFAFESPGHHRSNGHGGNAREYLFVEEGELVLEVRGKVFELTAGDLIEFPASEPHEYRQASKKLAKGTSTVFYALG